MEKKIIAILIFTSLVLSGLTQNNSLIIKNIREKFKEINEYKKYKNIILENEDFMEHMTDGGGKLTGFVANDTIYKIYEWIGISYGVLKFEFYYWNESLIFAYQTKEVFKFTTGNDSIEMSTEEAYELIPNTEKRYYFKNDTLIEFKKKGNEFGELESENEEIEKIKNLAKKNLEIIRRKM